jgi:hypothetical protein
MRRLKAELDFGGPRFHGSLALESGEWRLPVNSKRVEYIIKAWLKGYKIITLHQTRFIEAPLLSFCFKYQN